MIEVEHVQTVNRPIEDVFGFLADFRNRPLFESSVVEIQKLTEGEIGRGTEFREVRKYFGRRTVTTYVIDHFRLGAGLRFRSVSGPMPVEGEYEFTQVEGGTRIQFAIRLRPKGFTKLFGPFMTSTTRRDLAKYYDSLKAILESQARA